MSLPGPKSQTSQLPTHPYFSPVTGKHKDQVQVLNPCCNSSNPLGFPLQICLREEILEISALPGELWFSTAFWWHSREQNPQSHISPSLLSHESRPQCRFSGIPWIMIRIKLVSKLFPAQQVVLGKNRGETSP